MQVQLYMCTCNYNYINILINFRQLVQGNKEMVPIDRIVFILWWVMLLIKAKAGFQELYPYEEQI